MNTTVEPNYWSLLGVSPECDHSELKAAFRKEARKWHPDLNKNDVNAEERFKLINEAYAILSDPKKRKEWENQNYKRKDIFDNRFPTYEEYIDLVLGIKTDLKSESDDQYSEHSVHTCSFRPNALKSSFMQTFML